MSSKNIDASPPRRSSPTPVGRVRPSLFLPEKRKADGANLAEQLVVDEDPKAFAEGGHLRLDGTDEVVRGKELEVLAYVGRRDGLVVAARP